MGEETFAVPCGKKDFLVKGKGDWDRWKYSKDKRRQSAPRELISRLAKGRERDA